MRISPTIIQMWKWVFKKVNSLDIHMVEFVPLRGNSFIKLSYVLTTKHAIINIKNEDNQCSKWSVVRAALNPVVKNAGGIDNNLIRASEDFNWNCIIFLVDLKQIDRFERKNPTISVNVFGYEKSGVN